MNNGNIIQSFLALTLGFSFLMGSTGLTVILHSCHHCGDLSVKAGVFLVPEAPEDHCCEYADIQDHSPGVHAFIGENCHFRIDRVKLANYAPSGKVIIDHPSEIPFNYSVQPSEVVHKTYANTIIIHNKHGGRSMLASMCQFLS